MTSRLLVADDSITIQKIVSMAFETEGVEVEGVGDGQEAFDRIAEFNPDIVLADVDMPGLDGFELSAKIKQSSKTNSIKVLLLSSDFEDFDEQRYQKCGADNHILKPFKSVDIVALVKNLLDPSSNSDETVLQSGNNLLDAEEPVDSTESETLSDLDESEPSLDDLLASVEKLSSEGVSLPDAEEEVLSEPSPDSEEDESLELTTENSQEPIELSQPEELSDLPMEEPNDSVQEIDQEDELISTDDDLMDEMIRGMEDLKESIHPSDLSVEEVEDFAFEENPDAEKLHEVEGALDYANEPEIFAEVRQRKLDNMEDLDSTFKEIVRGGGPARQKEIADTTELSSMGGIVPEPEDLLESISPGTFSEVGKRPSTPEDIKENLDYISDLSDPSREMTSLQENFRSDNLGFDSGNDFFTQAISDEVKRLLQRSLGSSLEKEISGLSEVILQTIREVVREVTPEIARQVILEEIEKIKKQDMF